MKDEPHSSIQAISAEERQEYWNQNVRHIVTFAYDNAPAIREKFDKAGVKPSQISTTKDLELVPFTTRDEIIELQKDNPPFGGLLAVPPESVYKVVVSPGPIYVPLGSVRYCYDVVRIIEAAGMMKGDLVIISFPFLFLAGASLQDALITAGITTISAGPGNTELQVNTMRDLGVTGYAGAPSFLMTLLEKAEELGFDIRRDFKLKQAVVAAEPLLPQVKNTFEQKYGIKITNGIGIGLGPWLGYSCEQGEGFHVLEDVFIEIVDRETGKQLEPGEVGGLALTSFANDAFPLIRYRTGDLSSFSAQPCACGRTSPKFAGILGRESESIKVRALFLTPGQVKALESELPSIAKCQVVVSRSGHMDRVLCKVELTNEAADREKVSQDVQRIFKGKSNLRVDEVEFVVKGTIPEGYKHIVDERSYQ